MDIIYTSCVFIFFHSIKDNVDNEDNILDNVDNTYFEDIYSKLDRSCNDFVF
jgi:hypothetical protein